MKSLKKKTLTGGAALLIALPFVAGKEGLRNAAYYDPVQIPTICYGSTSGVKIGDYKTTEECNELLLAELKMFEVAINREIHIPLSDKTKAAFVSFSYNVGVQAFKNSTLLKKLNAGDVRGACAELPKWVYARGVKLNGLVKRRDAEMKLCLEGI